MYNMYKYDATPTDVEFFMGDYVFMEPYKDNIKASEEYFTVFGVKPEDARSLCADVWDGLKALAAEM